MARITTQAYSTLSDYKITGWKKSGLLAESYIRVGKQATIEKKHIIKKLGVLPKPESLAIKSILRKMYGLKPEKKSDMIAISTALPKD